MFVKIVNFKNDSKELIECKAVKDFVNAQGDLQLNIEGASMNSIIIGKDRKKKLNVYMLNNEGKTVDSINWR